MIFQPHPRANIPKLAPRVSRPALWAMCAISLACLWLAHNLSSEKPQDTQLMQRAASAMQSALEALRQCRAQQGLAINPLNDPNLTGLIGEAYSPITTSVGDLESKRTSTQPDVAALMVHLLREAGVKPGDVIAVGASGSFPALWVATLAAAQALGVDVVGILSLGASTWGANEPSFTLLHMHRCLVAAGLFPDAVRAASLGGDLDVGRDLAAEGRALLKQMIQHSGLLLLEEPDLASNVRLRMEAYGASAQGRRIAAFVNIGGGWAVMGESPEVLKLTPGLNRIDTVPPLAKRGVLFEMASRKIPTIHLLYMRGLVLRYGLAWDPIPLPEVGQGGIYRLASATQWPFSLLAGIYFSALLITLTLGMLLPRRQKKP